MCIPIIDNIGVLIYNLQIPKHTRTKSATMRNDFRDNSCHNINILL